MKCLHGTLQRSFAFKHWVKCRTQTFFFHTRQDACYLRSEFAIHKMILLHVQCLVEAYDHLESLCMSDSLKRAFSFFRIMKVVTMPNFLVSLLCLERCVFLAPYKKSTFAHTCFLSFFFIFENHCSHTKS